MQKKTALYSTIFSSLFVFILGFVAGVGFAVWKIDTPQKKKDKELIAVVGKERKKQIQTLQGILQTDPDNAKAWRSLGHIYYDANQPENAITAYNNAIALEEPTPDLLTDLGVMYRRIGKFNQALATFDEALTRDEKHIPSRFNKGVVLFHDLNKKDEAVACWQEIVQINPEAVMPNGESVRTMLTTLLADQDEKKNGE